MKTHHEPNRFRDIAPLRALIGTMIAALVLPGCGPDVPMPPADVDATMSERQAQAFVEAVKPRRPGTPVIAVLALNEGTETTDFLLPHAVLQRAGVAQVHAVAPRRGCTRRCRSR